MLTIEYIQRHTGAILLNNTDEHLPSSIEAVDFDTRRLADNSLYIALTIGTTDGHLYIEQAIRNGAKAILLSNEQYRTNDDSVAFLQVEDTLLAFQSLASAYRKDLNIPVIGITGSNGKTTSKDIISSLLSSTYKVHKTEGNFNNHLGVPLTLLRAKKEHEIIVLEMGMNHAGELELLGKIAQPDYVIITNIGESHIEFFGSREGIAHAKGELIEHMTKDGIVFLPFDCEFKEILASKTNEKKIYYRIQPPDASQEETAVDLISGCNIESTSEGVFFEVEKERYLIPLFGSHNVLNTLPAIFLAKKLGFTENEIVEGLKLIHISPMRFELVKGKNNTTLINDAYNASPTSMKTSAATFLNTFKGKRRVLVLGDMYELGENVLFMHQEVGTYLNGLEKEIECIVTIGQHSKYISGVYNGVKRHFDTSKEAAKWLQSFLHEDFVLFFKASRGMKLETVVSELK